jgi:hypothetical protein
LLPHFPTFDILRKIYLFERDKNILKKALLAILVITITVLGVYWFKGRLGINISEEYTLSEYFPFKYLVKDSTVHPEPGETIIDEPFNPKSFFERAVWLLWMRDEGSVIVTYDLGGINNSRCLLVESSSKNKWSYTYRTYIEVQKGDVFSFEGFARVPDKDLSLAFTIASFDKDRKIIEWNSSKPEIYRNNQFEMLTKQFTVADGTRFIRFRITGSGIGKFRFDDIKFRKLKSNK